MNSMQAIIFQETGNFDALEIKEIAYPHPDPGEVVVRIKAFALNHRDVWIIKGLYAGIQIPIILGSDGSGIVQEVGEEVDDKWLNKPVIINPALDWGEKRRAQQENFRILGLPDNGTQAEYVVVPVENLVEKPSYLSFSEAAAIPLAGLTGYRALFTQGKLSVKDTLLLTGIGGGVAALMLQMAVAQGVTVLVTSGDDIKIEKAIRLGAKGGANYTHKDWQKEISDLADKQGINLIVDSAGGDGFDELISLANYGARLVFFGATAGNPSTIDLRKIFWKQLTIQGTTMGHPQEFSEMIQLFEKYQIQPLIEGPYSFTQYKEAYQRMMEGTQFGKIVVNAPA